MVGDNVTTHASLVAWIGKPHGSNLLYDTLYSEGCVFFARTTQPQLIMHLETISTTYGRTVNPYNRNLTSGGSSGGESALLGMRGSLLVSGPRSLILGLWLTSLGACRVWEVILEAASDVHVLTVVFTASSNSTCSAW